MSNVPDVGPHLARLVLDPHPLSVGRDFEVHRGTLDGQAVTVKRPRPGTNASLDREALALARLAAITVVPALVGVGLMPDGRPALVRRWVDGVALSTLIERALVRRRWQGARRWNPPTRAIASALLDAVERVHAAGLVHNDLKPDDILVTLHEDGRAEVVLLDLGLAARPHRGGPGGTVAYAAPERLEGAPGTVRSDLWALGAVLFELLAGTRAYAAEQPVDARLERRHAVDRLPRPGAAEAWKSFPPEVQAALRAAVAADPKRRPRHVHALRRSLGLDRARSGAIQPARPTAAARRFLPNPPVLGAALATLAALLLMWGPLARGLGLAARADPAACEAVAKRADALCRGLSGEAACRAALRATDDCAARAELLFACEVQGP